MIVRITAEAEGDIEAIGDFIARDDPMRAARFVAELREDCLGLADFPERFPLLAGYEAQGIRRRLHGNYLIFYLVDLDAVTVLHVLHGAQDYGDLLG